MFAAFSKVPISRHCTSQNNRSRIAVLRLAKPAPVRRVTIARAGGDGGSGGEPEKVPFGYSRLDVMLIGGGLIGLGYALYYGLQVSSLHAMDTLARSIAEIVLPYPCPLVHNDVDEHLNGFLAYCDLQAFGMDAGMAGNYVQLIIFLGICVGWIGSYLWRVATKNMTYVKQLEQYEEAVMMKRLEEMPETALEQLMGDIEEEKAARANARKQKQNE